MKRLVLMAVMAAVAACSAGVDTKTQCPTDPNKQLSRAEWKACYGRQDKDPSGSGR